MAFKLKGHLPKISILKCSNAWCGTWCIMSSTKSSLNEKPDLMAKASVCPILTKSDDMCCPNIKQHADTSRAYLVTKVLA